MLLLGGGVAAQAAPSFPTENGSITIHKFEQPAANGPSNDGLELPSDATNGWKPLAGAEFTAKQVPGLDLSTNEGWLAAQKLTVDEAAVAVKDVVGKKSGLTNEQGLATILDLPLGMYFVEETTTPSGHIGAAPFLVAIPMTHPTDLNSWITNVHVYPKNALIGSKNVDDKDAIKIGDEITWTIRGAVQAPASGQSITGYAIADKLDKKLTYGAKPAVATITVPGAAGQLLADTDYKVTHFAATNTVAAILTDSGLAKLTSAKKENPTTQVQLDISTTVNAVGEITNEGLIFPNGESVDQNFGDDPTGPGGPTDPTDPEKPGCVENCYTTPGTETKWGNIDFTKVDGESTAKGLAGAEFQIYAVDPATQGARPLTFTVDGKPTDTFVSKADGKVQITGLRYSNWVNGAAIADDHADFQPYWIVETKAPAGYELLAKPIKVKVNEKVQVLEGAGTGDLTNIVNVKKNAGFELPLTGSSGTLLLTAGGILLVVVGGALAIRRKKNAA